METFSEMKIIEVGCRIIVTDDKTPNEIAVKLLDQLASSSLNIAKKLKQLVNPKDIIATFSNSKTIQEVLNILKYKNIIVFESTPGGEGKELVKNVLGNPLLVSDQEGLDMISMGEIKSIIISCDSYIPYIGIINKVGTKELVNHASQFNLPVFVLINSLKQINQVPKISSELLEFIEFKKNMLIIQDT